MPLAALSVDLDEIPCYHAIHGLEAPTNATSHAVYETAVPRLSALFERLSVPCTFFAIGQDLAHQGAATALRALADAGHEIANHTQNHRYEFTRLPRSEIEREIADAIAAIEHACGVRPTGFRAPGYTITDEVFAALARLDVAYDSSVFPCPAYYAAKAAAIGLIAVRGRRSHSIVDDARVLLAPAEPYRPASPYWRSRHDAAPRGVIELPIGVTRGLRLPYIGTSVMLAGPRGASLLTAQIAGRSLVNLELHGVDVLGASEDGLGELARHQRDLHVPVERKIETLERIVRDLRDRGYEFVRLDRAADQLVG